MVHYEQSGQLAVSSATHSMSGRLLTLESIPRTFGRLGSNLAGGGLPFDLLVPPGFPCNSTFLIPFAIFGFGCVTLSRCAWWLYLFLVCCFVHFFLLIFCQTVLSLVWLNFASGQPAQICPGFQAGSAFILIFAFSAIFSPSRYT